MLTFRYAVFILIVLVMSVADSEAQQKNSTRKIRIEPSDFAGQCGSTVQWQADFNAAIKVAKEQNKPIFWYVPTLTGSFMDRKPVIDQYMMAGPFAWPAIAELINQHFIPFKGVASERLQQTFPEIKTYDFVEPGFVVVSPNGKLVHKIDQLTTLDPYWIAEIIAAWAGVEAPDLWSPALANQVKRFRNGQPLNLQDAEIPAELMAEFILLKGMSLFYQGFQEQARNVWGTARDAQPDHPLAWKAVAESENWGPFCRGFEVHRPLPKTAYQAGIGSRGSAAPAGTWTENQCWQQATAYLLAMQNENGAWLDSDYDFGGTDSLPNVHLAITALCGNALWEARTRCPERDLEIREAVNRAASFCADRNNLNLADRDEILWAQAYRVRFLAKLVSTDEALRKKWMPGLQKAVEDLESIQTRRGAWYHEYANSFVTATALTALKVAANAGAKVNSTKIQRGINSLANDRFASGAFPYYSRKRSNASGAAKESGEEKIPESSGRMPICELGLWLWGGSSDERLEFALKSSFENHPYLARGYKYDNHTSTMAYGGFFFWYDMRSRAEALGFLKPSAQRDAWKLQHQQWVMALPELDGCFVDSHELGRCYGTAMALLTLARLDQISGDPSP